MRGPWALLLLSTSVHPCAVEAATPWPHPATMSTGSSALSLLEFNFTGAFATPPRTSHCIRLTGSPESQLPTRGARTSTCTRRRAGTPR
jgi:hypothetical protein